MTALLDRIRRSIREQNEHRVAQRLAGAAVWGRAKRDGRTHWFRPGEALSACSDHCEAVVRPGRRSRVRSVSPALKPPRVFEVVAATQTKGRPRKHRICERCGVAYEAWQAAPWRPATPLLPPHAAPHHGQQAQPGGGG